MQWQSRETVNTRLLSQGWQGARRKEKRKKKCCLWRFIVLYGARVLMIFSNSYLVVAEKYVYK